MNFWHIQLHPGDRNRFDAETVLKLLKKNKVIGMGEGWDGDRGQSDQFHNKMNIGDIVAVRDGGTPLALVEIIGNCEENNNQTDENWFTIIRPVKILSLTPPCTQGVAFKMTSCTLKREKQPAFVSFWYKGLVADGKMESLTQLLKNAKNLILTGAPGTGKTYLARQIAEMMVLKKVHDDAHPLSDDEKVKLSKQIGFCQFHPSYDYTDFVEGLRPIDGGDETIGFQRQDGIFKQFCKSALETEEISDNFEEVYSKFKSECDEKEGLEFQTAMRHKKFTIEFNSKLSCVATPQTGYGSKMQMKKEWFRDYLRNGTIPDWKPYLTVVAEYMKAKYNYTKSINKTYDSNLLNGESEPPFVFIIDEINRGDMAKIFGELFFAIDPGYRGENGRIKTQYSNLIDDGDVFKNGFYVPQNVYIIGTMNDIDRNVESMDFAIRRRFTWKEIEPEETISMWDNEKTGIPEKCKEQALTVMTAINNAIKDEKSGLGAQYQLGAAYFMKLRDYEGDFQKLWDWHIAPLLREYLRGTPEADKRFIDLKAVWDKSLSAQPNAEETEPPAQEQDNPSA